MTIPTADTTLPASTETRAQDALLVASLLHLMSNYSARGDGEQPCVKLASVIERHLCALARLPDLDPVLRATCEQLCERWAVLVDEGMPQPVKRNFLERIMRPSRISPA